MSGKNKDYEKYQYTTKEFVKYITQCMLLCVMLDYLFYKLVWLLLCIFPVVLSEMEKETADL